MWRLAGWALIALGCGASARRPAAPVGDALGDRCVRGPRTCCLVADRWRCAEPALSDALGTIHADTIRVFDDGIALEADDLTVTDPDYSHYEEGAITLYWLGVDGDTLTLRGAMTIGSVDVGEEWSPEDAPHEADDVRLTWTYEVRGPRCVALLAPSQRAVRRHGGETTTEVTVPELVRAPAVSPSPAPLYDGAGLLDRRGLWRLDSDGWRRVDRCDAPL